MLKLRIKKEHDKYVLSIVAKDLRCVKVDLRCKGVNRRGDDVLEINSSELVYYITEANRILEDVYG